MFNFSSFRHKDPVNELKKQHGKIKDDMDATIRKLSEFFKLDEELRTEGVRVMCDECAKQCHVQPYNKNAVIYVKDPEEIKKFPLTKARGSGNARKDDKSTALEGEEDRSNVDGVGEPGRQGRSSNPTVHDVQRRDESGQRDAYKDNFQRRMPGEGASQRERTGTEQRECGNNEARRLQKELEEALAKYNESEKRNEDLIKEMDSLKNEYDERSLEMAKAQSALESEDKILSERKTEMAKKKQNLEERIQGLEAEIIAKDEDIARHDSEKGHWKHKYETETSQQNKEFKMLTRQNETLNAKVLELQNEKEKMRIKYEREVETLCNQNRRCKEERERSSKSWKEMEDSLNGKLHELKKVCQYKDEEIECLNIKLEEVKKDCEHKSTQIGILNEKIRELEQQKGNNEEQLKTLKSERKELESTLHAERNENRKTIERLTSRKNELVITLESERKENRRKIVSLGEENSALKHEIAEWEEKAKKHLVLNFHTSLKQSLVLPAQVYIEKCMREMFEVAKVTCEFRPYVSQETTPGPILVLCMNVSRLGTDVKEAIRGTPGNQDVLVVILHHKEVHALPSQASERVLSGEDYKQLGAIIDAAFWTGRGMYECEFNKKAIEKIYNHASRFVAQK